MVVLACTAGIVFVLVIVIVGFLCYKGRCKDNKANLFKQEAQAADDLQKVEIGHTLQPGVAPTDPTTRQDPFTNQPVHFSNHEGTRNYTTDDVTLEVDWNDDLTNQRLFDLAQASMSAPTNEQAYNINSSKANEQC